jgi:PP-loop superfamily ATP-utilizing enzyme
MSFDLFFCWREPNRIDFEAVHLALYGKKPVVVLSSRPLDFSAVKGRVVEQMLGEPTEIVRQLKSRGFKHASCSMRSAASRTTQKAKS